MLLDAGGPGFHDVSDQPSPDLALLIAACANRDRGALATLYRLTSAKVFGVVLRILRDRQAAEDVLQEVYLRAWQNAHLFTPEAGRPLTWLVAIARNRAIDVVRNRRAAPLATQADQDAADLAADPTPWEADPLQTDRLRSCLATLDEAHRDCFILAFVSGYSREELALRFGRNVNTIKTWLHRSARSLRNCLGETA
ncbi:MAG: polymerase subunit sigma-70 [Enterovirga sp.]|nr:polymerase subunit sigma-70 [Enterovirga sp.]